MGEQSFPPDENGDVLRRMVEHGDNLSISRDIDFVVVMPNEATAERFAATVRGWGYIVRVEFAETEATLPWDVTIVNNMLPTHAGITAFEERLERDAVPLGGRNDGWGCMQQD